MSTAPSMTALVFFLVSFKYSSADECCSSAGHCYSGCRRLTLLCSMVAHSAMVQRLVALTSSCRFVGSNS